MKKVHMLSSSEAKGLAHAFRTQSVDLVREGVASFLAYDDVIGEIQFYFHPLGFIYAKVHEFANQETIRLHLWTSVRNPQKPVMDIHNHYYKVNSYVIAGTMTNQLFLPILSDAPTHVAYHGAYDTDGNRMLVKSKERVAIRASQHQIIQSRSFYSIGVDEFHASFVSENAYAATLVLTERPGLPRPTVFGPLDGEEKYYFINSPVPRALIDVEIARLQELV